jgi:hypothetical protein
MAVDPRAEDRLRVIAYHALWELFETDPVSEPAHFRKTRLDLHRELGLDDDLSERSSAANAPLVRTPELRVVPS